jgi:hypothetical protein
MRRGLFITLRAEVSHSIRTTDIRLLFVIYICAKAIRSCISSPEARFCVLWRLAKLIKDIKRHLAIGGCGESEKNELNANP